MDDAPDAHGLGADKPVGEHVVRRGRIGVIEVLHRSCSAHVLLLAPQRRAWYTGGAMGLWPGCGGKLALARGCFVGTRTPARGAPTHPPNPSPGSSLPGHGSRSAPPPNVRRRTYRGARARKVAVFFARCQALFRSCRSWRARG